MDPNSTLQLVFLDVVLVDIHSAFSPVAIFYWLHAYFPSINSLKWCLWCTCQSALYSHDFSPLPSVLWIAWENEDVSCTDARFRMNLLKAVGDILNVYLHTLVKLTSSVRTIDWIDKLNAFIFVDVYMLSGIYLSSFVSELRKKNSLIFHS